MLDGEEIYHPDCATGTWTGGWLFTYDTTSGKSVRVESNPLSYDSDGDGMSDRAERELHQLNAAAFPFHPLVPNASPVGVYLDTSDHDNVLLPGTGMVVTSTVFNNVAVPYYTTGNLRRTYPPALNSPTTNHPFHIFQKQQQQFTRSVSASGGSQTVEIVNRVSADLAPSATAAPSASPGFVLTETLPVIIDADTPTSSLVGIPYVQADGFRVIGGQATDPTSYVARVEVQIVGQTTWSAAAGGPTWAYTWQVPAAEGEATLQSRAIDAVGNVESPVNSETVYIDGTPPTLTTDQTGDPLLGSRRNDTYNWSIDLSGTVSDPLIGTVAGSGVQAVEVLIEPHDTGWHTAILDGSGNWQIRYPLAQFDVNSQPLVEPTGNYFVSLRAIDNVENITAVADYLSFPVRVDATAPLATLDSLTQRTIVGDSELINSTSVITRNVILTGTVTDKGAVAVGVDQVEIAFIPEEVVDALDFPLALYPLNEPLGVTAYVDASGGNHNGNCLGNRCPSNDAAGIYGGAVDFDGSNDVISVTLYLPESDLTISAWFNTTNSNSGIMGGDADRSIYLVNGNICAFVSGTTALEICSSGTSYADGNWHQAMLVLQSGVGLALYVDGQTGAFSPVVAASTLTTQTDLTLGRARTAADTLAYLDGRLDEVEIYEEAISADLAAALYRRWQLASVANPGATTSAWQYVVPSGLEGLYQIDVRSADLLGNRNDDQRTLWKQWRGWIDTAEPQIDFTQTYLGSDATAQTRFDIVIRDFALTTDGYTGPCDIANVQSTYAEVGAWEGNGLPPRISELRLTCTRPGHVVSFDAALEFAFSVTACDVAGHCAFVTPDRNAVYYATFNNPTSTIRRQSLDGVQDNEQLATGLARVSGLDLDTVRGHLYWLENGSGGDQIVRATLDGENPTALAVVVSVPDAPTIPTTGDLIVDATAGKLYWSESDRIQRANLDGSGLETVFTLNAASGDPDRIGRLAVDPQTGQVYFGVSNLPPASNVASQIWQMNGDGTNAQILVDTDVLTNVILTDIALTADSERLYWVARDYLDGQPTQGIGLWRVPTAGGTPTDTGFAVNEVVSFGALGISSAESYAYLSRTNTVRRIDLSDGATDNLVYDTSGDGQIRALAFGRIPGITNQETDLALSKATTGAAIAQDGGALTYQLQVTNNGPVGATDVTVVDTLPAGTAFVSGGSSAECAASAGNTVTCLIDAMNAGQSKSLTIRISVSGAARGLSNSATVSHAADDPNAANDTVTFDDAAVIPAPTAVPATGRHIYWFYKNQLLRHTIGTPDSLERLLGRPENGQAAEHLVVDAINNRVYFSVFGSIRRADLAGTNVATIFNSDVNQLAIDAVNGHLYFTTGNPLDPTTAIQRINLDGSGATTIIASTAQLDIQALAVNTLRGQLVWADIAGNLNRANLDGSNQQVIASGLLVARQIALDEGGDFVYFLSDQGIELVRMNGGGRELLLTDVLTGIAIDPDAGKLYFVAGNPAALRRADLDGGNVETVSASVAANYPATLLRLVFTDASVPPTPVPTATPTSDVPTPTPIPSPTPTASPTPLPSPTPGGPAAADFVYWSNNAGAINSAPLSGCSDGSCIAPIVTPSAGTAAGDLDIDWRNGVIFWVNPTDNSIQRANLDGSDPQTLVTGLTDPQGIALDLVGERVYWTDYSDGTIQRMTFDGTTVETVISGLHHPLWLDIDETNRYAYFIESEQDLFNQTTSKVRRITLDGASDLTDLLVGQANPDAPEVGQQTTFYPLSMGIVVDEEFGRLYWSENDNTGPARVRWMNVDGTDLRTIDDDDALTGLAYDGNAYKLVRGAGSGVDFFAPHVEPPYIIEQLAADGTMSGIGETTVVAGSPLSDTGSRDAGPQHFALVYPTPTPEPCPTDSYESNDSFGTATALTLGQLSAGHTFHSSADVDWFVVALAAGTPYDLRAFANGSAVDTVIELYVADGTTLVASNDDESGTSVDSALTYEPVTEGNHYLRVSSKTFAATCANGYTVSAAVGLVPVVTPLPSPAPSDFTPPNIDSAIITPADATIIDSLGATLITGTTYSALGNVETVTVTVDGAVVDVVNAITNDTWQTNGWSPSAEGSYVLASLAADDTGNVQTMTHPITVSVDLAPPAIGIDPPSAGRAPQVTVVFTQTHVSDTGQILLSGSATDSNGIALVELSFDGSPFLAATQNGTTWQFRWTPSGNLDGGSTALTLRATDRAGRKTTVQATLIVDIQSPLLQTITPTLGTEVLAYGATIPQALATLGLEWTAPTDGAGIAGVYVGYSAELTPTLSSLTRYTDAGPHSQPVAEAQIVYGYVIAVDNYGNQTRLIAGPFYVDGPATPDLVDDVTVSNWIETGGSQLAADRAVNRGPFATSPFGVIQRFYTSWDDDTLALAWLGANWNDHGDLFIYLDAGAGGATTLYDPYSTPAVIGMPNGFSANYLIWVQDDETATLYQWAGAAWVAVQGLSADQFHHDTTTLPLLTTIALPFSAVGLSNSSAVGVLAVASEEGALQLWTASPDQTPLNSERSINSEAVGRDLSSYDLTLFDEWSSLALGTVPNAGRFADSDLRVRITPNVAGVTVGYLESDLFDLLQPGTPIDADGDGVIDVALPSNVESDTVGNGSTIVYTVAYVNNGAETVNDVALDLTGTSTLNVAATLNLGDIAAGESGELTVSATVNGAAAASAELQAALRDAQHGTYDWFWIQHDVDTAAPTNLTILQPISVTKGLTTTLYGTLVDASAVPTLTLEITPQPAGAASVVTCIDATPEDGEWACTLDLGDLSAFGTLRVRVRATDEFGNTSGYSQPVTLTIDTTPPTVQLDATTMDALSDGFVNAAEGTLTGQVTDNLAAQSVRFCQIEVSGFERCRPSQSVRPNGTASGNWAISLAPLDDQDGVTTTVRFVGQDAAGNSSLPISLTFRVDTVAPLSTLRQISTTVHMSDYGAGSTTATPVLDGTATDGGAVDQIWVRLDMPNGDVGYQQADSSSRSVDWSFTPVLTQTGNYLLTVEVSDVAGNTRALAPVVLEVEMNATAVGLQLVQTSTSLVRWFAVMLGLVVVSGAVWLRRRRRS